MAAYGYRARSHYYQRRYNEAESDFSEFLNNHPEHPFYHFFLSNCHLKNDNRDRAVERFNSGIDYF